MPHPRYKPHSSFILDYVNVPALMIYHRSFSEWGSEVGPHCL